MAECLGDRLPAYWWRDKDMLVNELEAHGGQTAAATAHGCRQALLSKWSAVHGLPKGSPGPRPRPVQQPAADDDSWLLDALKRLGDDATVEQLADHCDVAPRRVHEAAARLDHAGFRVSEDGDRVAIERLPRPSALKHEVLFSGDTYRFGIVSDVHLGSKHCRLEELHIAYDRLAAEGITDVYNPGDIVAGRGIFRGQDHEILHHTFETQVRYAVANYPQRDNVTTRIISGNHDCEGDFGRAGADACLAVANQREDLAWGGRYAATYTLPNGAVMEMRHPMGGSSYAKSYKPQKFAESFEGGYKPAVVLFGHWHNVEWGVHRNIHMLNCGTFEGYGGSLGLRVPLGAPAVGFFLVELTIADDASVVSFRWEFDHLFAGRRAT